MAIDYERETAQEIYSWLDDFKNYIFKETAHVQRLVQVEKDEINRSYSFGRQSRLYDCRMELEEVMERIEYIYLKEDSEGESLSEEEDREYWANVLSDELRRNR